MNSCPSERRPMLTLYWSDEPDMYDNDSTSDSQWIIGANPRGLVAVVAALVGNCTLDECNTKLEEIKKKVSNKDPFYLQCLSHLRVLGRNMHCSKGINLDSIDSNNQLNEDIWLELQSVFHLRQLYCCGYRQDVEVHIIKYKTDSKLVEVPLMITPLLKLGKTLLDYNSDDHKGLNIENFHQISNARSYLEGKVIEPYVLQLQQAQLNPHSNLSTIDKELNFQNYNGYDLNKDDPYEHDMYIEYQPEGVYDPSVKLAPRLNYPTPESFTEFNAVLAVCNKNNWIKNQLKGKHIADSAPRVFPELNYLIMFLQRVILPLFATFVHLCYFCKFLDFKTREFINALVQLTDKSKVCGLHPMVPHVCDKRIGRLCIVSYFIRLGVDLLLGWSIIILVQSYKDRYVVPIRNIISYLLTDYHLGYMDWFEGWPGGFKANGDLNLMLTFFSKTVLELWRILISVALNYATLALSVFQFFCLFGLSVGLSFAADCCNITTLHLRCIFHLYRALYVCFKTIIYSLLDQFRGKKYNPLRKRKDIAEFEQDEVLIGTIIFTITVFLFPTLALHYYYYAIIRTVIWVVQEMLHSLSFLLAYNPVGQLLVYWGRRNNYPSGIRICNIERNSDGGCIFELVPKKMNLSSTYTDWIIVLKLIANRLAPIRLIRFIIFASSKPSIKARHCLYPHLVSDCVNPTIGNIFD